MATGTVTKTMSIGGVEFRAARTPVATGEYRRNPSIGPAKVGSLTARTDADTGTATMTTGHGLTTGRMDVFWANANGTRGCRYGMTGTVTGDSVALDGGGGDNLPPVSTALTVAVPQLHDYAVEYANLQALAVGCDAPACAVFRSAANAVILAVATTGANGNYSWDAGDPTAANPLSADLASLYLSHGDTAQTLTVSAFALVN